MCATLKVSRSAYNKWVNRVETEQEVNDRELSKLIIECHEENNGAPGYRMVSDLINLKYNTSFKEKKVYRIMKSLGLRSITRKKRRKYSKTDEQITAKNILNRNFEASKPNQKWVTDVTEFKTPEGGKIYLSAILDLYDRTIVSYEIGKRNNNPLVFDTFHKAIKENRVDGLIFHSDRGFQYTSPTFKIQLEKNGIIQSMSRPGYCIDNAPIEGLWGIIKSESYYNQKIENTDDLISSIENYILFYNEQRPQRRFDKQTPKQVRDLAMRCEDNVEQYPILPNNKIIKYFNSINKTKEQYAII